MDTITKPTPTEVVLDAWQVYRRSQQIPFRPALARPQSDLWHKVDTFTRTNIYGVPAELADTAAIEDALDALVAAVEWHCGPEAASFVAGDSEGRRAA